jgi:hypothetical protein
MLNPELEVSSGILVQIGLQQDMAWVYTYTQSEWNVSNKYGEVWRVKTL